MSLSSLMPPLLSRLGVALAPFVAPFLALVLGLGLALGQEPCHDDGGG
jgi:hypothetical protein